MEKCRTTATVLHVATVTMVDIFNILDLAQCLMTSILLCKLMPISMFSISVSDDYYVNASALFLKSSVFIGYLPGAVTPGAIPVCWSGAVSMTSRVGGHQSSIKNPIFTERSFCSPFLNTLSEEAWTM